MLLLQLPDNKDCVCCASALDEAKLVIVDWRQMSDEAVHNPFKDFHNLLCQLETAVISPLHCILLTLEEGRQWNSALSQRVPCHREWLQLPGQSDHRGARVTGSSYPLHHYAWWARCYVRLHLRDNSLTISKVIGMGGLSTGGSLDRWSGSQSNSTLRSLWGALTRPFALSLRTLTSPLHHFSPLCHHQHLHSRISSKLISKAVDFRKLGVKFS